MYFVDCKTNATKKVELVGVELATKKDLKKLQQVSLTGAKIDKVDWNLFEYVPSISELDLSENILNDWFDIASLAVQLPKLNVLNLSRNNMISLSSLNQNNQNLRQYLQNHPRYNGFQTQISAIINADLTQGFFNIQILVLNYCGTSWHDVVLMEESLPNLRELHLCGNNISSLQQNSDQIDGSLTERFKQLKLLNLEKNCISDWAQVLVLSKLPSLEKIILNENKLANIWIPDDVSHVFTSLTSLSLNHNSIDNWQSVTELDKLPKLDTLRFLQNPILKNCSSTTGRQLVIARIRNLTSLNGSPVRKQERIDSEKTYLKSCIEDPLYQTYNVDHSSTNFEKLYPRFKDLVSLYGTPATEKKDSTSIAEDMFELTIECFGGSTGSSVKKVPSTLTIANLKILCQRLFKIDVNKQVLFYTTKDMAYPDKLDDDTRTLSYYGVSKNGKIIVEEST